MKKFLPISLGIIGIACMALAIYYWRTPADMLPTFLPGHEAGVASPHTKHGLAAVILGLSCGVLAWFASGGKPSEPGNTPTA